MISNVNSAATKKDIVSPDNYRRTIPPQEKMNEALRKNMEKKFEEQIKQIVDKPASERTLEEKIILASYKTAQGLMDMKNYPPVIY